MTTEITTQLKAAARKCIYFKPIYPPARSTSHLTYFGGHPTLSTTQDWPNTISGEPLTFLGQVDLSKLRNFSICSSLPSVGILHFFMSLDLESEILQGKVIYSNESGVPPIERQPPSNAPACYGEGAHFQFPWQQYTRDARHKYPTAFDRWDMVPTESIDFPLPYHLGIWGEGARPYFAVKEALEYQLLLSTFGVPAPQNKFPPLDSAGTIWQPDAGFPYTWIFIEIWAGNLISSLEDRCRRIKSEPELAYVQGVIQDAHAWVMEARINQLHNSVGASVIERFWFWVRAIAAYPDAKLIGTTEYQLNKITKDTQSIGVDLCLTRYAEASPYLPETAIRGNAWRHVAGLHQMFGYGQFLQVPPAAMGTNNELLMQFSSDEGLDWNWNDCGALQFWIDADDLSARCFDRVFATIQSE
jgi:Domain of unknown function (DUF1963)